MINACLKELKAFLALRIKKIDFLIASIFGICIKFLDSLFLHKFTTISLTLLLTLTTLLSLAVNAFEAKLDDLITFNSKVSGVIILLKSWMKY